MFERKIYSKILEWKIKYANGYALLIEGARRVGKSTIVENFARNEYKSYILIDFAKAPADVLECFGDINNLNIFFQRIQAIYNKKLYEGDSVIIFDEIQLYPKARQAIKYLVADGRYHYIETGSLISIKKNVKNILLPSEEMKISMYPMDFEEFLLASKIASYELIRELFVTGNPVGRAVHNKLMRDFRIYMAVGGMPQAVSAYVNGADFFDIDKVKRTIISLYEDDFKKIDPSGRVSMLYRSIPSQISIGRRHYSGTVATHSRKSNKLGDLIFDLIDSKTVLTKYDTNDPKASLSLSRILDEFKLYVSDTGLFVSLMFMDDPQKVNEVYAKLLSDKLPANLGFLYENAAAQIIAASGRELFYHTWDKEGSSHYYEIDFLIQNNALISPIEIKSSALGKHLSLHAFAKKYSKDIDNSYIFSQKDVKKESNIRIFPMYMLPFALC